MTILVFNWRDIKNPCVGGAEIYTHEILKRLAEKGHRVSLFTTEYPGCKKEDCIDNVRIVRKGNAYSTFYHAFSYYKKKFKRETDLIIIDEINVLPWFTPFYVKQPVIALIHEVGSLALFYHSEVNSFLSYLLYICTPLMFLFYKYRKIKFITVSKSTKKDLVNLGIPEDDICIIYNGIDHSSYSLERKDLFPHLVYVGRVTWYKNVHLLVKAMVSIVKQFDSVRLTVVGEIEPKYKIFLNKLVKELNLSKHVNFTGYVTEDAKISILQRAWVLVNPSEREGWGIVVIEANACGTPAVGYNVPGLRDSIKDGRTGILIKQKNIEALADAVIEILENHELREKLSKGALEWSRKFSWNRSADEFLKIIEEVAE